MRYTFNYIFIKTVNQQIMKHIHTIKSYAAICTKNVYTLCIKILLSTNYTPLILRLVNLKNTDEIVQYNFNCNIFI